MPSQHTQGGNRGGATGPRTRSQQAAALPPATEAAPALTLASIRAAASAQVPNTVQPSAPTPTSAPVRVQLPILTPAQVRSSSAIQATAPVRVPVHTLTSAPVQTLSPARTPSVVPPRLSDTATSTTGCWLYLQSGVTTPNTTTKSKASSTPTVRARSPGSGCSSSSKDNTSSKSECSSRRATIRSGTARSTGTTETPKLHKERMRMVRDLQLLLLCRGMETLLQLAVRKFEVVPMVKRKKRRKRRKRNNHLMATVVSTNILVKVMIFSDGFAKMDHEHHNHGRQQERHRERQGERRRRRDHRERGLDFDARDFRRRHNRDEYEDRPRNRGDRGDEAVIGAIAYRRNFLEHQRIHNNAIAEAQTAADEMLKELEERRAEFERQIQELESRDEHLKELKTEKEKSEKMEIEMEQAVQKLCKLQSENAQKEAMELVVGMQYKDEEAIAKAAFHKERLQRIEKLQHFERAKSEALARGMAGEHFVSATARFRELEAEEREMWTQKSEVMANIRRPTAVHPVAPQAGRADPTAQAAPPALPRQPPNPASPPPPPLPLVTLD